MALPPLLPNRRVSRSEEGGGAPLIGGLGEERKKEK
jgi:hypothetical protein